MINIKDPKDCCGCTACASVCAHDAISMKPDALGFLYPVVDEKKCVDCGLCEKVCQFHDHYDVSQNFSQPLAYAARHKDMNEVMKSRSGAAFVAVSDYILEQGGVVYGAGYKDHFRVAHKRAVTKEERDEFRGSKYVQSDMTGVFRRVKEYLRNGLTVLFSGTPCQIAGLKAYVGEKWQERLYLMDIVCHSVPSPYIWRDYLAYLEKTYDKKICRVNFRDKVRYGWKTHKETFELEGGRLVEEVPVSFRDMFSAVINARQSCSICPFANLRRPGDITIGDYWGWQRTDPQFNADNKGCSLVLCNTEKGQQLFDQVKGCMNTLSAEIPNILQNHLQRPSANHPRRDDFERDYAQKGFEYVARHYGFMGWRKDLQDLGKRLQRLLKKVK